MKSTARSKAPDPPRTGDPPAFAFFNEIGIIAQLSRKRFERAMPDGLKLAHFSVLNNLVRLGDGRSPLALARAFQVTKGAMTNTLQRLEARGFVRLVPDSADGRGKRVLLTDKGQRARDACIAAAAPAFAEFAARFNDADILAALPFLQRVRLFLDEARDPKPKRRAARRE